MRVELVRIKFNDRDTFYKYKPIKYCCDKLRLSPVIELTTEEDDSGCYCNKCEKCKEMIYGEEVCNSCSIYNENFPESENLGPGFFICKSEEFYDWEDHFQRDYYYKIQYCPHCGEKIEISVVDEIDASEEYRELTSKRDELNKKRRKTDSKKREYELTEEIRELDKLINDFYYLTEYKEEVYK